METLKKKYALTDDSSFVDENGRVVYGCKIVKGSRSGCVYHIPGGLQRPSQTDELDGYRYSVYSKGVEQFDAGQSMELK
jgi:hypothetical protein